MSVTEAGERVAAAARALVGARFRLHGRDPALGLDCVGVAVAALRGGGVDVAVRDDYPLRTARWRAGDVPDELVRCAGDRPGDVLLLQVAATQVHVAVRTADGIVHADAALRRVVERPGVPKWPIVAAWRASGRASGRAGEPS